MKLSFHSMVGVQDFYLFFFYRSIVELGRENFQPLIIKKNESTDLTVGIMAIGQLGQNFELFH